MISLQTFQSRLSPGQLDILSAAEAGAVIGGTGCKAKSVKYKSVKCKSVKYKSVKQKSVKNSYCPPPPCPW